MSHVPERTELFVCTNCQVVSAGTPVHADDGSHQFEEPSSCGACGETAFVEISLYPRSHE